MFRSRYAERSLETDDDDELDLATRFYPRFADQPVGFERYLRRLIAGDLPDNERLEIFRPYKRRVKTITKGDPREFMG